MDCYKNSGWRPSLCRISNTWKKEVIFQQLATNKSYKLKVFSDSNDFHYMYRKPLSRKIKKKFSVLTRIHIQRNWKLKSSSLGSLRPITSKLKMKQSNEATCLWCESIEHSNRAKKKNSKLCFIHKKECIQLRNIGQ